MEYGGGRAGKRFDLDRWRPQRSNGFMRMVRGSKWTSTSIPLMVVSVLWYVMVCYGTGSINTWASNRVFRLCLLAYSLSTFHFPLSHYFHLLTCERFSPCHRLRSDPSPTSRPLNPHLALLPFWAVAAQGRTSTSSTKLRLA